MDNKRIVSLIKEMAREQNLRTMNFIVDMPPMSNEYLTEEKMAGGAGADKRGELSEVAMHHSIMNYLNKKAEIMSANTHMPEDERHEHAHNEAIEYLKSDEHHEALKIQVENHPSNKVLYNGYHIGNLNLEGKFEPKSDFSDNQKKKILAVHGHITSKVFSEKNKKGKYSLAPNQKIENILSQSPADADHTIRDSKHAAIAYINHLNRNFGHLVTKPLLTGGAGEIKTARHIGATNADLVISVRKRGTNEINNVIVPKGASLKYATKPSGDVKVRTPGEEPFHNNIVELMRRSGRDENHPDHIDLKNSYDRIKQAREGVGKLEDKEIEHIKGISGKSTSSLESAKSLMRQIMRGDHTGDKEKAEDMLNQLENKEKPLKDARIAYMQKAAKTLNSIYKEHASAEGNRKNQLSGAINSFHRDISGILHRRRRTAKIKDEEGRDATVPVVPTTLVKITRGKNKTGEYTPPKVRIHSLSNRLEKISKGTQWSASSTEGGGININADRGDGNGVLVFKGSLDSGSGKIVNMSLKKLKTLRKK